MTIPIGATREGGQAVRRHLASGIAAPSEAAGERYVNGLGGNVAAHCLAVGRLDEILPVLLGDGVRCFEPGITPVGLETLRATRTPEVTNLWLHVAR